MVWDGWQRYQHPDAIQQTAKSKSDLPSASIKAAEKVIKNDEIQQAEQILQTGVVIKVSTDILDAEINTLGGDIQKLDFLKQPDALDKNKNFTLFNRGKETHDYIAQSGLLGKNVPNHNTLYSSTKSFYRLDPTSNKVTVTLISHGDNGINVEKIFTFIKGSYVIGVAYKINNNSDQPINSSAYFQLIRDGKEPSGGSKMLPTYTGPAVYTEQEKFHKIKFSDIDSNKTEYPKETDNGWIGMLQHYFVAAWIPKDNVKREYFSRLLDNGLYSVGMVIPISEIKAGETAQIEVPLYAGPAKSDLDSIAPGLGLSVDYGWLTIIANPLFWLLTLIHGIVLNWGIAIIILTVLIKLIFFPLSAASYRSMAKMRVVAPKLEKLKQQYGKDRERLNTAMMDLYKTEKINPLGGCLPVLIQIPVFIALYWSILASVEMRYSPFFGWITDLSSSDPYYILPVIMGASMFLQSKLNPVPPDPIQAKLMQIMPIAFSVVFFFFPAGLVLYSIVNNVLSIAQQWYITRSIEVEVVTPKR